MRGSIIYKGDKHVTGNLFKAVHNFYINIKGKYDTLAELQAAITTPNNGDVYVVGEHPATLYVFVDHNWIQITSFNLGDIRTKELFILPSGLLTPGLSSANIETIIGGYSGFTACLAALRRNATFSTTREDPATKNIVTYTAVHGSITETTEHIDVTFVFIGTGGRYGTTTLRYNKTNNEYAITVPFQWTAPGADALRNVEINPSSIAFKYNNGTNTTSSIRESAAGAISVTADNGFFVNGNAVTSFTNIIKATNKAESSTTSQPVGTFFGFSSDGTVNTPTNTTPVLPPGGTWMVWVLIQNGTSNALDNNIMCQTFPGGTQMLSTGRRCAGFAIRIR